MPKKTPSTTVASYLKSVTADRKAAVSALRQVVLDNLPKGFEEGIQYGMIGYFVPHSIYPNGYHCDPKQPLPFAHIASQKSHIGLYLFCIYGNEELIEWFKNEYAKTGFKLDMGKACIRFKKPDQIPFELIGRTIKKFSVKKFIAFYESNLDSSGGKRSSKSDTAKATPKKKVTKTSKAATSKSTKRVAASPKTAVAKTAPAKTPRKGKAKAAVKTKATNSSISSNTAKKTTATKSAAKKSAKKKSAKKKRAGKSTR
ncbi:MAG: DUF1801 domain-containing protein [Pirellulaceae bacterium]